MMHSETFAVGDRVCIRESIGRVATVVNITPKRGDVVVKWDGINYKDTFKSNGRSKGEVWYTHQYITHYTEEIQKAWDDIKLVRTCGDRFDKLRKASLLTPELAKQILAIINPVYIQYKKEQKAKAENT